MVAQRGFAANGNLGSDPYQGTTSVVPTIMAGIKGFSPCSFFCPKSSRHAKISVVSSTGFSL
jgi:hypothetical protein